MKKEDGLENRRAELIDKLSRIELSASLVKKLEALLGQKPTQPMPYSIDDKELAELLCKQERDSYPTMPHSEAVKEFAVWRR